MAALLIAHAALTAGLALLLVLLVTVQWSVARLRRPRRLERRAVDVPVIDDRRGTHTLAA